MNRTDRENYDFHVTCIMYDIQDLPTSYKVIQALDFKNDPPILVYRFVKCWQLSESQLLKLTQKAFPNAHIRDLRRALRKHFEPIRPRWSEDHAYSSPSQSLYIKAHWGNNLFKRRVDWHIDITYTKLERVTYDSR